MQNSNAYEIHLPETVSTIPGRGDFADPNGQPRPLTHYFLEAVASVCLEFGRCTGLAEGLE
jgi:hypothetical protein